eukprot:s4030_g3.t1
MCRQHATFCRVAPDTWLPMLVVTASRGEQSPSVAETHGVGSEQMVRVVGHLWKHVQKRWRCHYEVAGVQLEDLEGLCGAAGMPVPQLSARRKRRRWWKISSKIWPVSARRGVVGHFLVAKRIVFVLVRLGVRHVRLLGLRARPGRRGRRIRVRSSPGKTRFEDEKRRNEKFKTMEVPDRVAFCASRSACSWRRVDARALGRLVEKPNEGFSSAAWASYEGVNTA